MKNLATKFLTNYLVLSILESIIARDGPVPGVDPQWWGRALIKTIAVTAGQTLVEQGVAGHREVSQP